MIQFTFFKNASDRTIGFKCTNHGQEIVCAAVSALTMNTINSIEVFGKHGERGFSLDLNEEGGFIEFVLTAYDNEFDPIALLFLDSLDLGICYIAAEYGDDIEVFVKEVYDA